jgi:two-component system, OmpR family, sensor histidine kinase BaeS
LASLGKSNRRVLGIGQLGRRLALAFVAVAILAIVVLTALTAITTTSDIMRFVHQQERLLTNSVAAGSAAAYDDTGWTPANLAPVLDVVTSAHASAQVRDAAGGVVSSSDGFAAFPGDSALAQPVVAHGKRVGWVIVRFNERGLGAAARAFQATRWRDRIVAGGIAALIALIVSVFFSRVITSPLEAMLRAQRARGAGDRSARVEVEGGVGIVREVVAGFNWQANVLDQQDRLQRNLVANVAHEIRTPIAILQAGHEAMLDGMTEPTPENLASLRDEVLRLARMVDDLQRLAAAEAAALQLKSATHDLAAIAADAADSLGEPFRAAGVNLVRRLTGTEVRCDPLRMREVITNLLTNALKFTPAGGTVVVETGAHRPDMARVRVTDTGIGIPPEDLPHVTERFWRGRRSADMAAGTGIGLTIVAELVRAQHGELEIASEPGEGTEVTVTIPTSMDGT